jgi:diamine N-acetyltransferase
VPVVVPVGDAPAARVRPARADDVTLLADLAARTFRETYAERTRPDDMDAFLATRGWTPAWFAAAVEDPSQHVLVVEQDGAVVGFARLADEPPPTPVSAQRPLMLAQLYLVHEAQGLGSGSALMRDSLALARRAGHDVVWLGVWEHNPRAIAFYRRWGFREVGTMPFDFGGERHRDLVMVIRPPDAA